MNKFQKFSSDELRKKAAFGEMIIDLLADVDDPRAPEAIERLEADIDAIQDVLDSREPQVVGMRPIAMYANIGR